MSPQGDEPPEVVIPDDALAVRAQPPARQPQFPTRAEKVWVVAALDDGSVMAYEFPEPAAVVVAQDWETHEEIHPGHSPIFFRDPTPTCTFTIRPYDIYQLHPRHDACFTLRIYPPGTWKL